ncbi:sensor histidine kinase [Clostridiales bacterium TF09-2AC]|nr:sensor histidine kinase [Clostridiales bacterium TF09-2AC]
MEYLMEYRGLLVLFLLFGVVFGAVFYGYHLPAEAVFYGAFLCFCLAVPVMIWNYRRFRKKVRILFQMQEALLGSPECYYLEHFPESGSLLEKEYQQFLMLLGQDRERMRCQSELAREEMTDYYTMWVHQIKTPIAAMRLLLQTPGTDPELSEQLFRIEEYVNMVLQYLRVDGDSDLIVQWNDLDLMVRQAVRRYAGMFIRKKLSLTYEPLNRKVLTDEKWLVFVVGQILSNAVKYTRQGGISIYLEPGPGTVLAIRDTGAGIAWEDQPRIFEKGFTGYNGHADKRSTGIGLYLCRRILNRLSHEITVESEPGKGTIMRIWFAADFLEVE